MVQTKVDTSGLRRKLRGIGGNAERARRVALTEMLTPAMASIINESPRDTHRLVRGWMMAANGAGLGSYALPPIRPSQFQGLVGARRRLERQAQRWSAIVARYERQNRTKDKWYRQAVRTRDRAVEELAKLDDTSLVIFGGRGRRLNITVRNKVYGGRGEMLNAGGRTFVRLHNLEPHASIIEKRNRAVRAALAGLRSMGVRRYGKSYMKGLGIGSGGRLRG